jgi:hypothetical protein
MTIRNKYFGRIGNYNLKFQSKAEMHDDGGGGSTGFTKPRNSHLENLYMADYMIALTRDRDNPKERYVKILKNKQTGKTGRADPKLTIELCSHMIAMSIFGDTLKLFRVELEEAIKETIMNKLGDAHDPFRRKSTGDGT